MNAPPANAILSHVRGLREEMLGLLEELTLLESPSTEPQTQLAVRERIADAFSDLGFRIMRVPGRESGGMFYAKHRARSSRPHAQMILGHYDTVWPLGTLASMPWEVDGSIVRGPGVYDMKAGITQAVMALRTLDALGMEPEVAPVVFLNSDEEIGSHESTRYIRRLAPVMDRVFVLEPSLGPAGKLKTGRKAVGRYKITVAGKAAHAGLDPESGASAILELSHVIQKLFSLNDPAMGITVNVGTIDGGLRPNVIAPESQAIVDVRTNTQKDAESVEREILALTPDTPGTSLRIEGRIGRPALERTPRNRRLWELARRLASEMGLSLEEGEAGGGSDGNTTSQFTATLDGLGAVGDGAHADHEHIDIDKTLERTALLARLLLAPPLSENES
jgi:glutamate carboxypeptidase